MKLLELFDKTVQVNWTKKDQQAGIADWEINGIQYQIGIKSQQFDAEDEYFYNVAFGVKQPSGLNYGNTDTGNQYPVYATVFQCMRDYFSVFPPSVVTFAAFDNGRQSLYKRFIKKFMPGWSVDTEEGQFILEPPKQNT